MKSTILVLYTILFSLTAPPVFSAQELNARSASKLKPFAHITVSGNFRTAREAHDVAAKSADTRGAAAFFITPQLDVTRNHVQNQLELDLFYPHAPAFASLKNLRLFNGVIELPKERAYQLQPFDTVSISGFFPLQSTVNQAISKAAAKKGAAAFYITRQIDANNGGNQLITAFIYKANAPVRPVQSPDLIPADSTAGKAALAAGGKSAQAVEKPNVAYQNTPPSKVGRFYQTQSGTQQRYTVTTSQRQAIQEVNNLVAAQMFSFDTITLTAHFATPVEITETIANRAAEKGAKYFHIVRQWQNNSGGNLTVTAELFH